jgi:prophage maintenance system killer protein
MTEYLNAEQLAKINRRVLKEVKVKRADSHRVADREKLESIVEEVRALGDVFEKATCLLVGLTKKHTPLTAETGELPTPRPSFSLRRMARR